MSLNSRITTDGAGAAVGREGDGEEFAFVARADWDALNAEQFAGRNVPDSHRFIVRSRDEKASGAVNRDAIDKRRVHSGFES